MVRDLIGLGLQLTGMNGFSGSGLRIPANTFAGFTQLSPGTVSVRLQQFRGSWFWCFAGILPDCHFRRRELLFGTRCACSAGYSFGEFQWCQRQRKT
jgi:hypothetical protein